MSISVVLVTYNRAALLPATLESILEQTRDDFELVISDDCSSDETEAICREYEHRDARVRYRKNDHRLRMPGNLNAALNEVNGDFVANLDDGDLYEPKLLEHWHDALLRFPEAAFVFNAYRHLDTDGSVREVTRENLPPCVPGRVLLEEVFFRRWRFGSPVWGTVMARRAAYDTVGPFDARFGFYADVDMWMRLAERFSVAYVDEPLLTLPSRDVAPRLFTLARREETRTLRRMFWEARMRHYRGRPIRRALETGRHASFTVAATAVEAGLATRRVIRERAGQGTAPRSVPSRAS